MIKTRLGLLSIFAAGMLAGSVVSQSNILQLCIGQDLATGAADTEQEQTESADPQQASTDEDHEAEAADATPKAEDPLATPFAKRIEGYVAAFNAADEVAIANFWSEQGEFVTPSGETIQGRSEISAKFKEWFAESDTGKLELIDPQVEIQSPNVAVETGIARVSQPDQEPSETVYRAVLVSSADGWKIDSISEFTQEPAPPSHYEQLQDLEWMVGQWENQSESAMLTASCRWTTNQNFLVQTYQVAPTDGELMEVTQIIGWDPDAESIRSWTFDSDGGFSAGRWSRGEDRWSCQTISILPDGRRGSATNIYELVDENNFNFSSIGRQVDGELMPNLQPVLITRVAESDSN